MEIITTTTKTVNGDNFIWQIWITYHPKCIKVKNNNNKTEMKITIDEINR